MAVRFLVGRSGSGKSWHCFENIKTELLTGKSGQNLILLVPEQSTYLSEKAILSDTRLSGFSRLSILSFARLGYWLGAEKSDLPPLSSLGRNLVVNRILRANADKLRIFKKSSEQAGLATRLCEMIVELQKYENTPADIENAIKTARNNNTNEATINKFEDIHLIYSEYLNFIENKWSNPDIGLSRVKEQIADSDLLKNSQIWVDGFSSFNTQERQLLLSILKVCDDATISLCLDPDSDTFSLSDVEEVPLDETGLFWPIEKTYRELNLALRKMKIEIAPPIVLRENKRVAKASALAHIEKNIFKSEPQISDSFDENIKICSAKNIRSEIEFVADEIAGLVREKGFRYRDFSLVLSDIDSYANFIRPIFNEARIPYFIDERKSVAHHALVVLLDSALNIASGKGSISDAITYLKTDLINIAPESIARIENHCYENGTTVDELLSARPAKIKEDADNAFSALRNFCKQINPQTQISAEEFCKLIFDFTQNLEICQTLQSWIDFAIENSDNTTADEHRQLYDQFIDVLDEMADVFEGESLPFVQFARLFIDGLSETTLAFIPPGMDQVMIGSIERTRHPDVKTVFLMGATSRDFPIRVGRAGLLTDTEREFAQSFQLELAETSTQQLIARQYFAYIALTRAGESMYITYPRENEKGGQLHRSSFIDHMASLFQPKLDEELVYPNRDFKTVKTKHQLCDLLCESLGSDNEDEESTQKDNALQIFEELSKDKTAPQVIDTATRSISYNNLASLEPGFASQLYPAALTCSVTRLSSFAKCPYQHFAKYVLGLKAKKAFKLEAVDLGTFYHDVLDKTSRKLIADGQHFGSVSDEQLDLIANEVIEQLLLEEGFMGSFKDKAAHNNFVVREASEIIRECVKGMAKLSKAGKFHLWGSELDFGKQGDALGVCELSNGSSVTVRLQGFIDRLDIAETDNQYAAIVFDYKTNGKKVNWTDIYHGLDLQLMVYLLAVEGKEVKNKTLRPAGAFFVPINVGIEKVDLQDIYWDEYDPEDNLQKFQYKTAGIFNGEVAYDLDKEPGPSSEYYNFRVTKKDDQYGYYSTSGALQPKDFDRLLKFSKNKIIELASSITSGKIEVAPYRIGKNSPCTYCDYKTLCRFDWQTNDYNSLDKMDKKEVLEAIERCGGNGSE